MKLVGKLLCGAAVLMIVLSAMVLAPTEAVSNPNPDCETLTTEGTWDIEGQTCSGVTHIDCTGIKIKCPGGGGPLQQT